MRIEPRVGRGKSARVAAAGKNNNGVRANEPMPNIQPPPGTRGMNRKNGSVERKTVRVCGGVGRNVKRQKQVKTVQQ